MDNDIPQDDKTIISGGIAPKPQADPSPDADDDDPFAVETSDPLQDPPVPDSTLPPPDTPDMAVPPAVPVPPETDEPAEMPEDAADTALVDKPVSEPDATDRTVIATPAAKPTVDEDRTQIATPDAPEPDYSAVIDDGPVMLPDVTDVPLTPEDAVEVPAAAPMPSARRLNTNDPVPVGTMINNNYEIKELISAGGMGEVFRGANAFTGDAVAIKIVLQSLANDPKIAALFMREAKVLCGLSDQAIVRYYNFVRDAELDRFCLIMEFIDGVSLSDFVRDQRPLVSAEARDLMRKVARGLDRAHEMDVVHRDLSPDNVMLRDGDVAVPVLIDFGIAKSTEMAENTLHGQLAGKFKYISPEQLGHFGGDIGPRTDIYGLALLIAAALRGEPLDMGSSVVEAVNKRREIPVLEGIPEDMKPILSHMLEPDPADRPAHMSDVIRLLDDPGQIPAKYGPTPIPPLVTGVPESAAPQVSSQPPGLRQPPGAVTSHTGLGISIVPGQGGDVTSASPFGTLSVPPGQMIGQTRPPVTAVPGLSMPPTTMVPQGPARRRQKRGEGGGLGSGLRWLMVLGLIGGLGYYVALTQGLLPGSVATTTPAAWDGQTGDSTETETGAVTRRSFLADYDAGPCSYAERISAGPNTGTIDAFAATEGVFTGLVGAYDTAFGSSPALQERIIAPDQCAVLDLARSLQKGPGQPPILTLDSDQMTSGGSIVGRLNDRRGRPVWLILVTTAGGVYNLTDRLVEQPDGSATFSFGLNATGSGGAEPQLIMAVASDAPLIAASAATNGARASSLLPLIESEIAGRNGVAGATLSFFDLLP